MSEDVLLMKNDHEIKAAAVKAVLCGKIQPFFQPIVGKGTCYYECLARLSDHTSISPYRFIQMLVEEGVYSDFTQTIIRKSFQYFQGKDVSFSVNLGYRDLSNTLTATFIEEKIVEYGMGSCLVIELLEEDIEDMDVVVNFVERVRRYGVRVAIDDFGHGSASFSRILAIRPDILKIDGSLIGSINTSFARQAIVRSIVSMAKELEITTVAEYVTNRDIYDALSVLSVDCYQGFYFGRPEATIYGAKNVEMDALFNFQHHLEKRGE